MIQSNQHEAVPEGGRWEEMKHVITESVEKQLVNLIIQYAQENQLTISNISEAVNKAAEYMKDNAVLEKGQVVTPDQ